MKLTSAIVILASLVAPASGFSSYADKMGGGKGAVKPGGYGPSKGKGFAPVKPMPGAYVPGGAAGIGSAPAAPAAAAAPPAPAAPAAYSSPAAAGASAPTSAAYLSVLGGAAGAPSGTGPKGYLDVVSTANTAINGPGMPGYLSVLRTQVTPGGAGLGGYLASMGGGSAVKASSFAPTKSQKGASAPAAAYSSGGSAMIAQEPVLQAINQLNDNMVRNQAATISVLNEINQSVKTLASKTI